MVEMVESYGVVRAIENAKETVGQAVYLEVFECSTAKLQEMEIPEQVLNYRQTMESFQKELERIVYKKASYGWSSSPLNTAVNTCILQYLQRKLSGGIRSPEYLLGLFDMYEKSFYVWLLIEDYKNQYDKRADKLLEVVKS